MSKEDKDKNNQINKALKGIEKELKASVKEYKKLLSKTKDDKEKIAYESLIKTTESLINEENVDLKNKAYDSIARMNFAKMELFYLNGIYNLFLSGIITLEQFVSQTDNQQDRESYVKNVVKSYTDLSNAGVIK